MKRTHKEIIKTILEVLKDGKLKSYGELERKVDTNWKTIRDNCELLRIFEVVIINKNNKVQITERGRKTLTAF